MANNHSSKIFIACAFLLGTLGCSSVEAGVLSKENIDTNEESDTAITQVESTPEPTPIITPDPTPTPAPTPTPIPTCDGINVTSECQVDGVMYATYIYHPAVPEQSHIEEVTTTEQVISYYCTLCVDGTWSPSCAVGRGACSHHGGVAQYNAPVYSNETNTTENKVIDSEAVESYYETVEE